MGGTARSQAKTTTATMVSGHTLVEAQLRVAKKAVFFLPELDPGPLYRLREKLRENWTPVFTKTMIAD